MQPHDYFPDNKNDMQFPTHLFINIVPEWVDHQPVDIDGMKMYKIKCWPREWIERTYSYVLASDTKLHILPDMKITPLCT